MSIALYIKSDNNITLTIFTHHLPEGVGGVAGLVLMLLIKKEKTARREPNRFQVRSEV